MTLKNCNLYNKLYPNKMELYLVAISKCFLNYILYFFFLKFIFKFPGNLSRFMR